MILAAALTGHPVAPSYASWHGAEALFACLGVIAVGSALLVVTARNVVHAALWLVVTLGALAGGYLLMTAELVAWVQVLIYIGAVVVLLLFATMLTRAPIGRSLDLDSDNKVLAAIVGLATAATLVFLVIWLRVAYPRLREDQLQKLAWTVLVPLALLQVTVTAVVRVATA